MSSTIMDLAVCANFAAGATNAADDSLSVFWLISWCGAGHLGTAIWARAIASALTFWALGRLGAEDVWAPPFRRCRFGAVSRHCH